MRIYLLMTFTFCVALIHTGAAQTPSPTLKHEKLAPMYKALFVLRSDYKTVELDPKKNEFFDVQAIDARQIKYVAVLKKREAMKLYGEKGSDGVVIVQFADDYIFSRENVVRPRLEDTTSQ